MVPVLLNVNTDPGTAILLIRACHIASAAVDDISQRIYAVVITCNLIGGARFAAVTSLKLSSSICSSSGYLQPTRICLGLGKT
jgi:hypothetical protein